MKAWSLAHALPVLQPPGVNAPESVARLRELAPDLIIVAAYGAILKAPLLDLPPRGCINLHASILPRYRGAAPIPWAIMNGEPETGVSIMRMNRGMDTGDVALIRRMPIGAQQTAGELSVALAELGAKALEGFIDLLASDQARFEAQDCGSASYAPKITKDMARIDWSGPARSIVDKVRGLQPAPVAFSPLQGEPLRIFRCEAVTGPASRQDPGLIRVQGDRLLVATGDGWISILELQRQNRQRLPVEAFLRGARKLDGLRFEPSS